MPLRADVRRVVEWGLRVLVIVALVVALWRSLHPSPDTRIARHADSRGLDVALRSASADAGVASLDVAVGVVPSRVQRGWLRALRRVGILVTWHGAPVALAMEAERTPEPVSRVRVSLAGSPMVVDVRDSAGTLDSARVTQTGAVIESPAVVGAVTASGAGALARVDIPPARAPRAVLVLGRAGWESKFVSAALQEAGWVVRARAIVAPGVVITDAGLHPLDTARYDIVVALDSTAGAMAGDVARFVRAGGGLVLAGDATSFGELRALAPARTGARRPGRILLDGDSVTRGDLPLRPLVAVRNDAVRVEGTAVLPLVAIRRAAVGRVATVAYDESWRWRMLGGESGASAHRAWWSRTVALVSPAGPPAAVSSASDPAPLASLVDALGEPQAATATQGSGEPMPALPMALLALIALALLAEVASRRFRGAR